MNQLTLIHDLLIEEYAASRHIWWQDETSGAWVNDVAYSLRLIRQTAECLQVGEKDCWERLVSYCLERAMPYRLLMAIGEYLSSCRKLQPLSPIEITPDSPSNEQGGVVPLLEETDHITVHAHAVTAKPEPDRLITVKQNQAWTPYPPRFRDEHPAPRSVGMTHKSIHWLF